MYTTEFQRKLIQDSLEIELLKRGFTAKLKDLKESKTAGHSFIEFTSEPFQTVPVLFKEIKITNFGSSIVERQIEGVDPLLILPHVWIQVHVSYNHFEGGSNGSHLFDFRCILFEEEIIKIQIT